MNIKIRDHRLTAQQLILAIVGGTLLLSFIQMAMQLFIYESAKRGISDLERIDQVSTQRLKQRDLQVLAILHNQDQLENTTNTTLSKMLKMEGSGK
jgi:hypothetical protein